MSAARVDELVRQMENYLECWKQFNLYMNQARTKKFEPEDEAQFLEIKSILTQELELIFSAMEAANPKKEDILLLISETPSIRYLSEQSDQQLRSLENQWHKIYIGWQSLLGQLKVQQRQTEKKGLFSSIFKSR
jgi:hypothetical protein